MRTGMISGEFVNLRIAEECDAKFTLEIRNNDEKNMYIPKVTSTVEQQKEWIKRQAKSDDCYFFVVERKNSEKIGAFSLYNIQKDTAESGRLVMRGNPLETLETGILFHRFAFETVGIKTIHSEMDADNTAALGFSKNFGAVQIRDYIDEGTGRKMIFCQATRAQFEASLPRLERLMKHFSERK